MADFNSRFASSANNTLDNDIFLDQGVPNLYVKGKYTRINGTVVQKPGWLMAANKELNARDAMRQMLNSNGYNGLLDATANSFSPQDVLRDAQQSMLANTASEDDGTILQGWLINMIPLQPNEYMANIGSIVNQINIMPNVPDKMKYNNAMSVLRQLFQSGNLYAVINALRQASGDVTKQTAIVTQYTNNVGPPLTIPMNAATVNTNNQFQLLNGSDGSMPTLPNIMNPQAPTQSDYFTMNLAGAQAAAAAAAAAAPPPGFGGVGPYGMAGAPPYVAYGGVPFTPFAGFPGYGSTSTPAFSFGSAPTPATRYAHVDDYLAAYQAMPQVPITYDATFDDNIIGAFAQFDANMNLLRKTMPSDSLLKAANLAGFRSVNDADYLARIVDPEKYDINTVANLNDTAHLFTDNTYYAAINFLRTNYTRLRAIDSRICVSISVGNTFYEANSILGDTYTEMAFVYHCALAHAVTGRATVAKDYGLLDLMTIMFTYFFVNDRITNSAMLYEVVSQFVNFGFAQFGDGKLVNGVAARIAEVLQRDHVTKGASSDYLNKESYMDTTGVQMGMLYASYGGMVDFDDLQKEAIDIQPIHTLDAVITDSNIIYMTCMAIMNEYNLDSTTRANNALTTNLSKEDNHKFTLFRNALYGLFEADSRGYPIYIQQSILIQLNTLAGTWGNTQFSNPTTLGEVDKILNTQRGQTPKLIRRMLPTNTIAEMSMPTYPFIYGHNPITEKFPALGEQQLLTKLSGYAGPLLATISNIFTKIAATIRPQVQLLKDDEIESRIIDGVGATPISSFGSAGVASGTISPYSTTSVVPTTPFTPGAGMKVPFSGFGSNSGFGASSSTVPATPP